MQSVAAYEDWIETSKKINGLWPEWEATDAERELFEGKLRNLDQSRLRKAIDEAYLESRFRRPTLGKFLAHYRGMRSDVVRTPDVTPQDQTASGREVAEMRGDLLELSADQISQHLDAGLQRLAVWKADGISAPGAAARTALAAEAPQFGLDPAIWPELLVGFVWCAMEQAAKTVGMKPYEGKRPPKPTQLVNPEQEITDGEIPF